VAEKEPGISTGLVDASAELRHPVVASTDSKTYVASVSDRGHAIAVDAATVVVVVVLVVVVVNVTKAAVADVNRGLASGYDFQFLRKKLAHDFSSHSKVRATLYPQRSAELQHPPVASTGCADSKTYVASVSDRGHAIAVDTAAVVVVVVLIVVVVKVAKAAVADVNRGLASGYDFQFLRKKLAHDLSSHSKVCATVLP
jgi:ABC-type amino acid transport system permease subunit